MAAATPASWACWTASSRLSALARRAYDLVKIAHVTLGDGTQLLLVPSYRLVERWEARAPAARWKAKAMTWEERQARAVIGVKWPQHHHAPGEWTRADAASKARALRRLEDFELLVRWDTYNGCAVRDVNRQTKSRTLDVILSDVGRTVADALAGQHLLYLDDERPDPARIVLAVPPADLSWTWGDDQAYRAGWFKGWENAGWRTADASA